MAPTKGSDGTNQGITDGTKTQRLKMLLAEAELDKKILKVAAEGNF